LLLLSGCRGACCFDGLHTLCLLEFLLALGGPSLGFALFDDLFVQRAVVL
jgi:hypothetical protein